LYPSEQLLSGVDKILLETEVTFGIDIQKLIESDFISVGSAKECEKLSLNIIKPQKNNGNDYGSGTLRNFEDEFCKL